MTVTPLLLSSTHPMASVRGTVTVTVPRTLQNSLVDIAVLLGSRSPVTEMDRDERAALRTLSAATHDAVIGFSSDAEPGRSTDFRAVVQHADAAYWQGNAQSWGPCSALWYPRPARGATPRTRTRGQLRPAFWPIPSRPPGWPRTSGDHEISPTRRSPTAARSPYRQVTICATRILPPPRRGSTFTAMGGRRKASRWPLPRLTRIEPKMSEHDPDRLSVYGQLVTNAAVRGRGHLANRATAPVAAPATLARTPIVGMGHRARSRVRSRVSWPATLPEFGEALADALWERMPADGGAFVRGGDLDAGRIRIPEGPRTP